MGREGTEAEVSAIFFRASSRIELAFQTFVFRLKSSPQKPGKANGPASLPAGAHELPHPTRNLGWPFGPMGKVAQAASIRRLDPMAIPENVESKKEKPRVCFDPKTNAV